MHVPQCATLESQPHNCTIHAFRRPLIFTATIRPAQSHEQAQTGEETEADQNTSGSEHAQTY
jgi:hypothetical protein